MDRTRAVADVFDSDENMGYTEAVTDVKGYGTNTSAATLTGFHCPLCEIFGPGTVRQDMTQEEHLASAAHKKVVTARETEVRFDVQTFTRKEAKEDSGWVFCSGKDVRIACVSLLKVFQDEHQSNGYQSVRWASEIFPTGVAVRCSKQVLDRANQKQRHYVWGSQVHFQLLTHVLETQKEMYSEMVKKMSRGKARQRLDLLKIRRRDKRDKKKRDLKRVATKEVIKDAQNKLTTKARDDVTSEYWRHDQLKMASQAHPSDLESHFETSDPEDHSLPGIYYVDDDGILELLIFPQLKKERFYKYALNNDVVRETHRRNNMKC